MSILSHYRATFTPTTSESTLKTPTAVLLDCSWCGAVLGKVAPTGIYGDAYCDVECQTQHVAERAFRND